MTALTTIEQLEREYILAHYDNWGSEARTDILRKLAAAQEAADPALKARRLRTKALDLRDRYARNMTVYGDESGRAAACKDPTIAKLIESAAKAALDEASECLTKALAAEAEADAIQTGGFVVLFPGVSAKQRVEA